MKNLLRSLALFLLFIPSTFAQEPTLPDVYIQNFEFEACDEQDEQSAISTRGGTVEVIHRADDSSFFDIASLKEGEANYKSYVFRTYCFSYTVANKGAIFTQEMLESDSFDDRVLVKRYATDEAWRNADSRSVSPVKAPLESEEVYTNNSTVRINLSDQIHSDQNCIGLKLLLNTEEADETNNSALLCFDPEEKDYQFPPAPQNFMATRAEGNTLELTWDEVEHATDYQVVGISVSPNADFKPLHPTTIEGNKATFEFLDDDFYCLEVRGINDWVIGPASYDFCYGLNVTRFNDVPISSWYFPYMQELQANGIIDGYKNGQGKHTGYFGPADYLTTSEALKLILEAFGDWKPSNPLYSFYATPNGLVGMPESDEATLAPLTLPAHLKTHWAEDYFVQAYEKQLSLVSDFETFNPDRPITRAEMLQLFLESMYAEIPPYTTYTANDIANSPYADLIEFSYRANLVNGYPDGSFGPQNLLNRAEAVKMMGIFRDFNGEIRYL